jgi:hypothetical protein
MRIWDGSVFSVERMTVADHFRPQANESVAQSKTEAGFEPARLLRNISRRRRHIDSTELVVPFTRSMIGAVQRTDPRCENQPVSPEDAEAPKQLSQIAKRPG